MTFQAKSTLHAAIFAATLMTVAPASAASPCCGVVSVDTRSGVVTAQDQATQRRFEFKVENAILLRRIQPGQAVSADMASGKVTIDGIAGQYNIVAAAAGVAPAQPAPVAAAPSVAPVQPALPTAPRAPAGVIGAAPPPAPQAPTAGVIGAAPSPAPSLTRPPTAPAIGAAPSPLQPGQRPPAAPAIGGAPQLAQQPQSPRAGNVCGSDWWRAAGSDRRFECGKAGRPAVLLFHGLHQGEWNWTVPASHEQMTYDYNQSPKPVSAKKESPGVGIFKIGKSDQIPAAEVNANNYVALLKQQGFTVATWTQRGPSFERAYQSAVEAYNHFRIDTAALNPASPPPIALLAHSRGGLVIRRLLKEQEKDMGRVRWVITLHSPHHGSEMARAASQIVAEVTDLAAPLPLPQETKTQLRDLVVEAARPLTKFVTENTSAGGGDESRELMPGGPLFRALESGEKQLSHIKYYTFGGTNPRYYRLYMWMFTAESAVPQFSGFDKYFKWEANPVEIAGLSPMFDKLRDIVQEIKPGKGDGLVTDVSAQLPKAIFSNVTHATNNLNHAEVLWDPGVQQQVLKILSMP